LEIDPENVELLQLKEKIISAINVLNATTKPEKIDNNIQQTKKRKKEIDLFADDEEDEEDKVIDNFISDEEESSDEEISLTLYNKPVQSDPVKFTQHGTLADELRESLKILSISSVKDDKELGEWEKYTRGVGSKLLLGMGYKMGTGLGISCEGIIKPLNLGNTPRGAHGLGFEKEVNDKRKKRKKEPLGSNVKNEGTVFAFLNKINNKPQAKIQTNMRGIWFFASSNFNNKLRDENG